MFFVCLFPFWHSGFILGKENNDFFVMTLERAAMPVSTLSAASAVTLVDVVGFSFGFVYRSEYDTRVC